MSLSNIIAAAEVKFGSVMAASLSTSEWYGDFYFLTIRRNQSPTPYLYMTITAKWDKETPGNPISFMNGHYDLSAQQAANSSSNEKRNFAEAEAPSKTVTGI